jgi:hypothetical protein
MVRQATAVLINEEPFVGVVVLTREESAPVTGSTYDEDPTGARRIRAVVATSLTRECDAFRRDKAGHTVARLIDTPVADEHEIESFTREEARLYAAKGHRTPHAGPSPSSSASARAKRSASAGQSSKASTSASSKRILGHICVTTTERYTHVASPQVRDASALIGSALWGIE